jgi:hypothetical protein
MVNRRRKIKGIQRFRQINWGGRWPSRSRSRRIVLQRILLRQRHLHMCRHFQHEACIPVRLDLPCNFPPQDAV